MAATHLKKAGTGAIKGWKVTDTNQNQMEAPLRIDYLTDSRSAT